MSRHLSAQRAATRVDTITLKQFRAEHREDAAARLWLRRRRIGRYELVDHRECAVGPVRWFVVVGYGD